MLRKAKLFNAITMILLLVGSVYSSKAWYYYYKYQEGDTTYWAIPEGAGTWPDTKNPNIRTSTAVDNIIQVYDLNGNQYIRICSRSNNDMDDDGGYDSDLISCGKWIDLNTHSCPSGYSFNSSTNKCEANPTITCPTGYTYNSSIKKCQANPVISCPTN